MSCVLTLCLPAYLQHILHLSASDSRPSTSDLGTEVLHLNHLHGNFFYTSGAREREWERGKTPLYSMYYMCSLKLKSLSALAASL